MFYDKNQKIGTIDVECFDFLFSQGGSSVFGSLVVIDVVFRYLSLFLLYINIKIGKIDNKC